MPLVRFWTPIPRNWICLHSTHGRVRVGGENWMEEM